MNGLTLMLSIKAEDSELQKAAEKILAEVNAFMKQFDQMKQMMKMMNKMPMGRMPGMPGMRR